MKKLILLFFLLSPSTSIAEDTMGILVECDPSPVFRGNVASLANYSGTFSASAWDSCKESFSLKVAKEAKIAEVKEEGLALMQAQIPGIKSFDMAGLVVQIMTSILQAAWDLTPEMTVVKNTWQSGSFMAAEINALTTEQQVTDYVIAWD